MNIKKLIYQYKCIIALFAGIIIGTCYINFIKKSTTNSMDIYSSNYLTDYLNISINSLMLWKYVVKVRLRDFIVLCIAGLTVLSNPAILIYMCYIGICGGILISTAVMHYGLTGILIYMASVFPQYIFYGIVLYFISRLYCISSYTIKNITTKKIVLMIGIAALFLIAGTYLEAYINPVILKKLYVYLY